jgi:dTDP-4-dehydrorhamnose reductase
MMRVLITGATGQLGGAMRKAFSESEIQFIALGSSVCDITDIQQVQDAVLAFHPDWIVNSAAYTQVARAEKEAGKARLVNAVGPENLAKVCSLNNVKLMHFSTDYVFDGLGTRPYVESDKTHPLSVYGASKALGEEAIRTNCENHLILRISWLYDNHSANFVSTMKRLMAKKDEIQVVNDQVASPTSAIVLASDICQILKQEVNQDFPFGTYHYSHEGECSWCEFANEIKDNQKLDVRVVPVDSNVFNDGVKRPAYSKLDPSKIQKQFNLRKLTWKEAFKKTIIEE